MKFLRLPLLPYHGYCYKRSHEARRCIWHRQWGCDRSQDNVCVRPTWLGTCHFCRSERLMGYLEAKEYRDEQEILHQINCFGRILDTDERGCPIVPSDCNTMSTSNGVPRPIRVTKYRKVVKPARKG